MKGLLDVADNLERAIGAAREDDASEEQAAQRLESLLRGIEMTHRQLEKAALLLSPVLSAVSACSNWSPLDGCGCRAQHWRFACFCMAECISACLHRRLHPQRADSDQGRLRCMQAFQANGVTKVEPKVGDRMDPNLHEALFDIPDPNQEPGTIGVITKVVPLFCLHAALMCMLPMMCCVADYTHAVSCCLLLLSRAAFACHLHCLPVAMQAILGGF